MTRRAGPRAVQRHHHQDYTPLAFKQLYVAKLRHAKLDVIKDSRHALPMEKPAAFNAVLGRFLADSTGVTNTAVA